jgi:predicted PurR-regulated permease PerM
MRISLPLFFFYILAMIAFWHMFGLWGMVLAVVIALILVTV